MTRLYEIPAAPVGEQPYDETEDGMSRYIAAQRSVDAAYDADSDPVAWRLMWKCGNLNPDGYGGCP